MNLGEMFTSIGTIGFCVMGCLLGLSLYSMAVIVEKYRRFRTAQAQSDAFMPELGRCLKDGSLQDAAATARKHQGSHVAQVVSAGVAEMIAEDDVEFVSRALDRSADLTLAEMKRGLAGLATIGSTAPFIGLFGTVVGIIHSFQGISSSGSGGLAAVSGGIAEALVATAAGILVAMPAVMAFNYFTGTLERFQIEINSTAAELVDTLTKRSRAVHASR